MRRSEFYRASCFQVPGQSWPSTECHDGIRSGQFRKGDIRRRVHKEGKFIVNKIREGNMRYLLFTLLLVTVLITTGCVNSVQNTGATPAQTTTGMPPLTPTPSSSGSSSQPVFYNYTPLIENRYTLTNPVFNPNGTADGVSQRQYCLQHCTAAGGEHLVQCQRTCMDTYQ